MESSPEELEQRFCQPQGWRWHGFERKKGRYLRFGSVSPKDRIPDAVVVCLPGATEFAEKYFETAQWCLGHNFSFWILEWAGEGKSSRLIPSNPEKLHSSGFNEDVEDLGYFIRDYIKHSSVHPDKGRIPMVMLGHSMGAHIGLRYLIDHPEGFECACFTTPFLGLKALEKQPHSMKFLFTFIYRILFGSSCVPNSNKLKNKMTSQPFTSDKQREALEEIWAKHDPDLRPGNVTYRWVFEAQRSCMRLGQMIKKTPLDLYCLFAFAGKEDFVDNALAQEVIGHLPNVKVIDYPGAEREILMENDEIRDNFLGHFYNLIKETIIDRPETLKPF